MNDFTALKGIRAPGTAVFGYQRGDAVGADVVENWELAVGEQVCEGDLDGDAPEAPAPARPGPEANRASWEAWAIANGKDDQWAAEASQEDLEAVAAEEPAADSDRPADSAKKADWVAYAEKRGADPAWAEDATTTKADLQGWEPPVGDTVAVAATEAN